MPKKISTTPPDWMQSNPKPTLERRRFHNIEIEVWVGEVSLDEVTGWIGNPRTEMQAEQFTAKYGRPPTDDEMYQIVLTADDDPEAKEAMRIRDLAADIYKNGVRVPLVLGSDRRLLDGNRRYYALMFLAREGAPREKSRFMQFPAIVLPEGVSKETENAITTEFNFRPNLQEPWPYFVKAMLVHDDHVENGVEKDDLVAKYGVDWRYLSKWIQAAKLCVRFLEYHERSYTAMKFAYNNFIMFDEMMRNYPDRFKQEDFRDRVFDVLLGDYPDNHRFRRSSDVVRLDEIWDTPESWDTLVSKRGPQALKEALTILDVANLDSSPDPNPKLRRVVKGLEKLSDAGALAAADRELLAEFHLLAEQIPGAPIKPDAKIAKMIEWLDNMTSLEMAELEPATLNNLRIALERVLEMASTAARATTARGRRR